MVSADVLAAFGATGEPEALAGGQRTVWRVGDLVFKPLDTSVEYIAWQAEVLGDLTAGVRIAAPRRALGGRWVVDGWTAWRYEAGERRPGAWVEIAAAGRELHRALADLERPEWPEGEDDTWARAQRLAWSATTPTDTPLLRSLVEARRPLEGHRAQLVHTDLTGNVLFADGAPPLVLDLSFGWHPPAYASAIVAVDAMLWEGAPPEIVDRIAEDEAHPDDFGQFLVRAVLFRLLADRFLGSSTDFTAVAAEAIRRCG